MRIVETRLLSFVLALIAGLVPGLGWSQTPSFTKGAGMPLGGTATDTAVRKLTGTSNYEVWTGFTTTEVGVLLVENAVPGTIVKAPTGLPSVGSIGVGDLNGDGVNDVVAASYGSGLMAILLRNGSGGLGSPTTYAVPGGPTDVTVVDWDGDGDGDVLVSLYQTNRIAVFLNQGPGVLGTATYIDSGPGPNGMTTMSIASIASSVTIAPAPVADDPFVRRSLLRGVTANFVGDTVSVVAPGGCVPPQSVAADDGPAAIVTGDVTSDGRTDIITLNQTSGTLSTNVASSNGNFGSPVKTSVGANPLSLALLDYDLDGHADVVVTNHAGSMSGVSIYRGSGTGAFTFAANLFPELGAGSRVETADFDGDGRPDIGVWRPPQPPSVDSFFDIYLNLTPVCAQTSNALCIGSRFSIEVDWSTSQGGGLSGTATAVPGAILGFKDGGLFWFFDADNPEMLVKVLNGCATNNRYWVFSSATTNVFYRMEVTDTRTGTRKIYTNPDLTQALPVQDTSAFATCP